MALAALQALGVPRPFQHFKDEAVQDQLVAATALGDRSYKKPRKYPVNCYRSYKAAFLYCIQGYRLWIFFTHFD